MRARRRSIASWASSLTSPPRARPRRSIAMRKARARSRSACASTSARGGRDAPDDVADIVGHEQAIPAVHGDTDRAAIGFRLGAEETAQHLDGLACRLAAI